MDYEDFKRWVGTKDPEETYDFIDNTNCALGQYLQSLGYTSGQVNVGPFSFTTPRGMEAIPGKLARALVQVKGDYTFGDLVKRMELVDA